mmetsp:Transcript_21975/g.41915  ORF Transcript_21975/g.41915 Transcript_21975/m.41915 type:complete len:483 (-) Transcript_21975:84-1532(-)
MSMPLGMRMILVAWLCATPVAVGRLASKEAWTTSELPNVRHGGGCGDPVLHTRDNATRKPHGTIFVNDKSKGISWLLALEAKKSLAVDLPYAGGNHEGRINPDGVHIAIPHYETAGPGSTEGGGIEGSEVSLLNLDTGFAEVAPGAPSPLGNARPHDAAWTPSGRLLVTAQLKNAVTDFGMVLNRSMGKVAAGIKIPPPCQTPHLLANIPGTELVVSGCRCSNPDTTDCTSALAVVDAAHGTARAIEIQDATWTEAITVTEEGDVWVGGLKSHNIFVFGFQGQDKTPENLKLVATVSNIPNPLRMAYDKVTKRVGVASLDLDAALDRSKAWKGNKPPAWDGQQGQINFRIFNASTRALQREVSLHTRERGLVNMEGLFAADGFFVTGGFDTAAMVLVDAESGQVAAEVYFDPCSSLPAGFCEKVYMSNSDTAKANGSGGYNNWSGGYCPAHMRTPNDRRFMVMDGFGWSAKKPSWAQNKLIE